VTHDAQPLESLVMKKGRFGQLFADGAAFSFEVEQKRPPSFFQGREM